MAAPAQLSPAYPPGDSINLPEIMTDSESDESDEDDNDDQGGRRRNSREKAVPDWVQSPALRELLAAQQMIDPEQIFGPIGPLSMEEMFRGSKDRAKRFRDRTSSANWSGADRLTEEERRWDRDRRERLMRDGGWTFQPVRE